MQHEVWSSGLERWEPCEIDEDELIHSHNKTAEGRRYAIFQDGLGRFFRREVNDDDHS